MKTDVEVIGLLDQHSGEATKTHTKAVEDLQPKNQSESLTSKSSVDSTQNQQESISLMKSSSKSKTLVIDLSTFIWSPPFSVEHNMTWSRPSEHTLQQPDFAIENCRFYIRPYFEEFIQQICSETDFFLVLTWNQPL